MGVIDRVKAPLGKEGKVATVAGEGRIVVRKPSVGHIDHVGGRVRDGPQADPAASFAAGRFGPRQPPGVRGKGHLVHGAIL